VAEQEEIRLEPAKLFFIIAREAFRDGIIEDAENKILRRLYKLLGLSKGDAAELAIKARDSWKDQHPELAGSLRPEESFRQAVQIAWADGVLEKSESELLKICAQILGIDEKRGERIIAEEDPEAETVILSTKRARNDTPNIALVSADYGDYLQKMENARENEDWTRLEALAVEFFEKLEGKATEKDSLLVDEARADAAVGGERWERACDLSTRLNKRFHYLYDQLHWPAAICQPKMDQWLALAELCRAKMAKATSLVIPNSAADIASQALAKGKFVRSPVVQPSLDEIEKNIPRGELRFGPRQFVGKTIGASLRTSTVANRFVLLSDDKVQVFGLKSSLDSSLLSKSCPSGELFDCSWHTDKSSHAAALAPSGDVIALAGASKIELFGLSDEVETSWPVAEKVVSVCDFSPCGLYLLTAGTSGRVDLWDLESTDASFSAKLANGGVHAFFTGGKGLHLVAMPLEGTGPGHVFELPGMHLVDEIEHLHCANPLAGPVGGYWGLRETDSSYRLVVASIGGGTEIREVVSLPAERLPISSPTVSPDGSLLAWLGKAGVISVLAVESGQFLVDDVVLSEKVEMIALCFLADGRLVAFTQDGYLRVLASA